MSATQTERWHVIRALDAREFLAAIPNTTALEELIDVMMGTFERLCPDWENYTAPGIPPPYLFMQRGIFKPWPDNPVVGSERYWRLHLVAVKGDQKAVAAARKVADEEQELRGFWAGQAIYRIGRHLSGTWWGRTWGPLDETPLQEVAAKAVAAREASYSTPPKKRRRSAERPEA